MTLHIAKNLTLPLDTVTSTLVVYGGKGMGKTNFGNVLIEELTAVHQRFVVVDPMGVWWGARHDASGAGKGIEALILGGTHADLPIEPTAGAVVADLVVDEDVNVIIDISRHPDGSMWSIGERIKFVTDFAKRLYQRQGEKRRPLHLVIDEAARFAPQVVRSGEIDVAKCVGAVAVIVEEGRNVGLGVTLITQRSARLNKDVAELADCMVSFRTIGPNSMDAVLDWLGKHVDKKRVKELSEELRTLPRGSALVVSPGWLEFEGVAQVRKRTTFDSSATPEAGKEQASATGTGAKPDLAKYRARMAEVIERQKESDPKALRGKIAELEKQIAAKLGKGKADVVEVKEVEKVVERVVIERLDVEAISAQLQRCGEVLVQINGAAHAIHLVVEGLQRKLERVAPMTPPPTAVDYHEMTLRGLDAAERTFAKEMGLVGRPHTEIRAAFFAATPAVPPPPRPFRETTTAVGTAVEATADSDPPQNIESPKATDDDMDRRVTHALWELSATKLPATMLALAAWMGMHPRASNLLGAVGRLRKSGHLDGMTLVDPIRPPDESTANAICASARSRLRAGLTDLQLRILDAIGGIDAHEIPKSTAAVAIWVGMHPRASNLLDAIGKLRSRGYLDGLDQTAIGANAVASIQKPSLMDLIEPLDDPQKTIVETIARWPSDSVSSVAVLANTIGVHPRSSTFLNGLGVLRARGMLTKGWPVALTDAMRVG